MSRASEAISATLINSVSMVNKLHCFFSLPVKTVRVFCSSCLKNNCLRFITVDCNTMIGGLRLLPFVVWQTLETYKHKKLSICYACLKKKLIVCIDYKKFFILTVLTINSLQRCNGLE